MILALLATLGAIVVALVLYPVFSEDSDEKFELDELERELRELEENKARLYENIKDLDFEKDSGKVSKEDYEAARGEYMTEVAAVLARIDALAPSKKKKAKKVPPKKTERVVCASCGESNPKGSKFCLACGTPFGIVCSACGEKLPPKANFCNACGEKVAK